MMNEPTAAWTAWFAWLPVEVETFKVSEIKNGHLRYHVWMRWVERRIKPADSYDDEYDGPRDRIQYRLPQD